MFYFLISCLLISTEDLNKEADATVAGIEKRGDQAKAVELPPIVVSTKGGAEATDIPHDMPTVLKDEANSNIASFSL